MHSHDRTLLASLAFGDKDKQDKRHDQGCRYLATPEVTLKLASAVFAQKIADGTYFDLKTGADAHIDSMISKGEGKYKTTIGFADVVSRVTAQTYALHDYGYSGRVQEHDDTCDEAKCSKDYRHHFQLTQVWKTFLCEVKIGKVPVGDIIRQLTLYNEYFQAHEYSNIGASALIVACAFPLTAAEIQSLRVENIRYAFLGSGFEKYCLEEEAESSIFESFEL